MLFPSPRWARDNRGEEQWDGAVLVARTSGEHSQLEVEVGRHSVALYLSKNGMIEPKFEMGFSTLAAFSLQRLLRSPGLTYIYSRSPQLSRKTKATS